MREQKNEFLSLLCNMYIVALLVALPLYTGDGYGRLGITKYVLFRNVSLLCLGCWLVLGMPGRIRSFAGTIREIVCGSRQVLAGRKAAGSERHGRVMSGCFSMVDCAVAAYGICVLLSALCSRYRLLAWVGYEEWYMGAFSQLMFVGIYFFVSRQYDGSVWPLYMGEAALFLVSAFGLLHKLGIDPLGLQRGWNNGDWVYSHMLSTLGNINWLCGFYSVALAFVVVHYLREGRLSFLVPLYGVSVSAFVLLGVQGSQGGLLIIGVCVAMCLLFGRRQGIVLEKIFLLLAGFFLCMPLMGLLMDLRGEEAAVMRDGNVFAKTTWYEWVAGALVCMVFYVFFCKREGICGNGWNRMEGKACGGGEVCIEGKARGDGEVRIEGKAHGDGEVRIEGKARGDGEVRIEGKARGDGVVRRAGKGCNDGKGGRRYRIPARGIVLAVIGLCAVAGFGVFVRRVDDRFGSGRGFLWRIAMESFAQADFKEKLLGAGPDCFGAAVFARLGAGTDVWKGDRWDGSVFTNAHNEILNQLCNVGILGTVSYLAIFAAGLRRYRDIQSGGSEVCGCRDTRGSGSETQGCRDTGGGHSKLYGYCDIWGSRLGLLAIAMYGAHSLISFQQVLNAPLLFLVLGLCEYGMRSREELS